jgi:hypothetical protein
MVGAWLPAGIALSFAVALLLGRLLPLKVSQCPLNSRSLALAALWSLLPVVFCAIFSVTTGNSIFLPRYFLWSAPGLSLLLGGCSAILSHGRRHCVSLIAFAILSIAINRNVVGEEDWKDAIAVSNQLSQDAPLLAYTGLVESIDTHWLLQKPQQDYLLSVFSYYHSAVPPLLLPAGCDSSEQRRYFRDIIIPAIQEHQSITLILRKTLIPSTSGYVLSPKYFQKCFAGFGFAPDRQWTFDGVDVLSMKKRVRGNDG